MFCHLELFWVSAAQWSLPGHVLIILNGQEPVIRMVSGATTFLSYL